MDLFAVTVDLNSYATNPGRMTGEEHIAYTLQCAAMCPLPPLELVPEWGEPDPEPDDAVPFSSMAAFSTSRG